MYVISYMYIYMYVYSNIVRTKRAFMHNQHQCIVFELLSLSLYELLKRNRFRGFSIALVSKFAKQLFYTLNYLNRARTMDVNGNVMMHNNPYDPTQSPENNPNHPSASSSSSHQWRPPGNNLYNPNNPRW